MIPFVANMLKKKLLISRFRGITGEIKLPLRRWLVSIAIEKLVLRIVTREEMYDYSKTRENCVLRFGREESVEAIELYNYSSEMPKLIARKIGTFSLDEPFVTEVTSAELIGSTAVGFSVNKALFLETVAPTSLSRVYRALPAQTLILKLLPDLGFL